MCISLQAVNFSHGPTKKHVACRMSMLDFSMLTLSINSVFYILVLQPFYPADSASYVTIYIYIYIHNYLYTFKVLSYFFVLPILYMYIDSLYIEIIPKNIKEPPKAISK